ncbi:3'-5' exoribonuclease, partial [bacterium BMS3Abin03]|nr:3'-5' exoribonuclease [bacterium BMS3Abin03]
MIKEQLPSTLVEKAEFSVIDVETTGLSARTNRIIEIGIVKVKNLKVTDRYETLINPGTYIPDYITQLTGITEEDVFDAPFFEDIAEEVKQFIGDSVLSGHNLPFDHSFFSSEFLRCGLEPLYNEQVCTLKIARRIFPELKSKSLSSVTQFLNLRNPSSHRALADAEVTARILIKMIKKLKKESNIKTIDDLIGFQRKKTFGKQIHIKESLKEDVSILPNSPGIYYFINKFGKIIYVGKAKSLRDRIRS